VPHRYLTIVPSPSPDVELTRYNETQFPEFQELFQPLCHAESSPLSHFHRNQEEANVSLVLENHSSKAITVLSYCWHVTDKNGQVRRQIGSEDSYMAEGDRPVAAAGSRHLLSPASGRTEAALLEHVRQGGGTVAMKVGTANLSVAEDAELKFEIQLIVFEDGELLGEDPEHYAARVQCRKPAAEFVAAQIRAADLEGRDVTPVLSALAKMPFLRDDFIAYWTRHFALHYLSTPHASNESKYCHIEGRQAIPKFFRNKG